jgi:probable addiction module antidote protein
MEKTTDYQKYLIDSLKDPEEAAGYLNASLEEGDLDQFLLALRNVAQAQGGINKLANKTTKGRTSLYKTLSEDGNPYLKNTCEILSALGMKITIQSTNLRS